MKCKNCDEKIKHCGCGVGHGYIHKDAPVREQLHVCWPHRGFRGRVKAGDKQGKQATFAQPASARLTRMTR